jgi:hypothetical protein
MNFGMKYQKLVEFILLMHTVKRYLKKLNSILGVDEKGILYIGKSKNIRERLRISRVLNPKLKAFRIC